MTNKNVVVSDTKSAITMAITVAVKNSTLFSPAVAKPPATPGGYITISRKNLLKKLENGGGGAKIHAWVDSMRASSPTRKSENDDQNSWIVSLKSVFFLVLWINFYQY